MTSSSCVAAVARVVPQCFVGLVLLVTSMSYYVSSQGSTQTLRQSTTSQSAAYTSLQHSSDVVAVTSSEWRPLLDTVRIKMASNMTVTASNWMNRSAVASSTFDLEHPRNNTSATETTSPTWQLRQRLQEDVVDSEPKSVKSDYASPTEDVVYGYHDDNWDGNQEGDAEDEEDGNHSDDDDDENDDDVSDNEYLENHDDNYYQENISPDRATAFNYSSDYDVNSHSSLYYGGDNEMRRGASADDLSHHVNFDVHFVRDIPSDDLASHRLMSSGSLNTRSEPINMSLLVIYSWLGLVAVMIVCTVIIYKYKEPMNNAWQSFYLALCHRKRRSRGIEESNTLLTHPLV